jgi:hypothetical protein
MKKTKQTKRSAAEKAVQKPVLSTQTPIEPPAPEPVVESASFDPGLEELAYDERGEPYFRKTPRGMLEEAQEEVEQRELAEYLDSISLLREKGFSFRAIAEFLTKHGVTADHNSVYRIFTKGMTEEEVVMRAEIDEEQRERAEAL